MAYAGVEIQKAFKMTLCQSLHLWRVENSIFERFKKILRKFGFLPGEAKRGPVFREPKNYVRL